MVSGLLQHSSFLVYYNTFAAHLDLLGVFNDSGSLHGYGLILCLGSLLCAWLARFLRLTLTSWVYSMTLVRSILVGFLPLVAN